jgi:hypothetical protein
MDKKLYLGMAFILLVMVICVMVNNCDTVEPFIEAATAAATPATPAAAAAAPAAPAAAAAAPAAGSNHKWLLWKGQDGKPRNWQDSGKVSGGKPSGPPPPVSGTTVVWDGKSSKAYYKCKNKVQINTLWNGKSKSWTDKKFIKCSTTTPAAASGTAVAAAAAAGTAASAAAASAAASGTAVSAPKEINSVGARKNILSKLSKYRTFVSGDIRDFLRKYDSEGKIIRINPDWWKPSCSATWSDTKVKCFTFVELYDASKEAEKKYKEQKQASDINRLRASTNRDYDRLRKVAAIKYKLDRQKQRKAFEKLALYKKLIDSEDYDASFVDFNFKDIDSLMDYDFNKKMKELDDIIRKKDKAKGKGKGKSDEDKKKEEDTRKATKPETALTKKYMDSEFGKVIDRIGTIEKKLEDESKRDALMDEQKKKEGEQLPVTQKMPEKVDTGVDVAPILDNEDKMKKFDDSCKYITTYKKDYGFGADGYSFMKDKHWGEPNQQPPSNCASNCEPAGMYASGSPIGVLNLTSVGTILPSFKYTEGGYKCPQPKRGNNKFADMNLLSTDKGALDASAWKGTGYRYGQKDEADDIYYVSKKEYADKMGKDTGRELDRFPMSVDTSKAKFESLSEREKTATCELCARPGSNMCLTNPMCKNCAKCDNWGGKEKARIEKEKKEAVTAAAKKKKDDDAKKAAATATATATATAAATAAAAAAAAAAAKKKST